MKKEGRMVAISIGDKVWVQVNPMVDEWQEGTLLSKNDGGLCVRLDDGLEVTVAFNCVARWSKSRILQKNGVVVSFTLSPVTPDLKLFSDDAKVRDWLAKIEAKLGVSIPYATPTGAMVVALLPREAIIDNSSPSWKEMAMIGDALWHAYLRIALIGRGRRNGEVARIIGKKKWETRQKLKIVGRKLKLNSLLPILAGKLHDGETAEAFLGWAYTFGGEEAYLKLAEKYLELLE